MLYLTSQRTKLSDVWCFGVLIINKDHCKNITSGVGVLGVVLEVLLFLSLLLVQGFRQTSFEEFQQVQIACTPFESGVLQMAWWF